MFIPSDEKVIEGLKKIGARLCAYTSPGEEWAILCDCKYGASGHGEQTGCAEVRAAIEIILERKEAKPVNDDAPQWHKEFQGSLEGLLLRIVFHDSSVIERKIQD